MDYVDDLRDLVGREVVDPHGDKIGRVSGVYVDDATGEPSWLAVTTGWFGKNVSFVPFAGSYLGGDELVVAYEKDVVRGAPNCGADRHLNGDEEYSLYDYYDLAAGGYSRPDLAGDVVATPPRDAHGRTGEDDAMTRSEEELEVSKHRTEVVVEAEWLALRARCGHVMAHGGTSVRWNASIAANILRWVPRMPTSSSSLPWFGGLSRHVFTTRTVLTTWFRRHW